MNKSRYFCGIFFLDFGLKYQENQIPWKLLKLGQSRKYFPRNSITYTPIFCACSYYGHVAGQLLS